MPKKTPAKRSKRDLSTYFAAHDPKIIIPNKIRAALEKMCKDDGPEAYAYEFSDHTGGTPFTKLAGVSIVNLNAYREQFAAHVVEAKQDTGNRRGPRWVWFATVKAAKAARGE